MGYPNNNSMIRVLNHKTFHAIFVLAKPNIAMKIKNIKNEKEINKKK
jgi:hypothetical protein